LERRESLRKASPLLPHSPALKLADSPPRDDFSFPRERSAYFQAWLLFFFLLWALPWSDPLRQAISLDRYSDAALPLSERGPYFQSPAPRLSP